jgi:hypothetical protein
MGVGSIPSLDGSFKAGVLIGRFLLCSDTI